MTDNKTIREGLYQIEIEGDRLVVDVRMTMQGQWPETREILMAHPLSGPPRFPWPVSELQQWGARLTSLTATSAVEASGVSTKEEYDSGLI